MGAERPEIKATRCGSQFGVVFDDEIYDGLH